MTSADDAVRILVEALEELFLTQPARDLHAYQVGSTLRRVEGYPVDLDVWLIRTASESKNLIPGLDALRKAMAVGQAQLGTLDATDRSTQAEIRRVLADIQPALPKVRLEVQFAIGPVPQPRLEEPIVYVQVCGPLSSIENRYFFEEFPFHGRCFLDLNRPLARSLPLNSLVTSPSVTYDHLVEWTRFLKIRSEKIIDEEQQAKCLRKILMNYAAFVQRDGIYNLAESELANYTSDIEPSKQIEQACSDIFSRSLPGLQ